jgi:hypothetical protein
VSNQRGGKWKPASLRGDDGMSTVTFFKNAKEVLERSGKEDEAFYFEQMETWLRDGNRLPTDTKDIAKALGV